MNEHLNMLLSSTLQAIGADPVEISHWQTKFGDTKDPVEWEGFYAELTSKYDKLDEKKRLFTFINSSKLDTILDKEVKAPEPPEEVMAAIIDHIKEGKNHMVIRINTPLSYQESTTILGTLCERINQSAGNDPNKVRLPFLITPEQTLDGQILSLTTMTKRGIPLVTAWASEDGLYYQWFGQAIPKGLRRVTCHIAEFLIYKFRANGEDMFLFSPTELKLEPCKITGMRINAVDYIKVGELAKIPASTPCYFVHHQVPMINAISEEEFKKRTTGWDMEKLVSYVFGIYRQPPWFEKLILAWLFSAKFSGYPLHLAILSPAGVGKTSMMEGIAKTYGETIASGSQDTIRGLIPSFGNGIPREGYLATCKRIALLDEFFAMVKKSSRQSPDEVDSGTYMMLEILEHKEREARSGNGSIKISPRMKAMMVANSKSYHNMKSLVEVTEVLNYAFLSRWFWYCLTPAHKEWVMKNRDKVLSLDPTKTQVKFSAEFVEITDYLNSITVQNVDMERIKAILKEYREFIPMDLAEKIYDPRADHHLLCMLDGYTKINSIIENRGNFVPTERDYVEVGHAFGDIVLTWASEVNLMTIPIKNRVSYLPENLKVVYDYIDKNQGLRTPELNMVMGVGVYEKLKKLEEYQLLKTMVDVDGTTLLWYPYWTKIKE